MHVRLEKCFDEEKNATFLRLLELCRFDLNQFSKPMIQAHLCRKKETSISSFIICSTKAELLQEGIFFLICSFASDVLVMKKLEIEKTKPTFIISVLKVEY